jgi:GNAT superfamily N-acetyltransferase
MSSIQVSPMSQIDQISIRRLTPTDDLAGAIGLLCAFFREEGFPGGRETIEVHAREMARLDICGIFVAEAAGTAVGIATVSLEFGIEYGWSAEMGDLYIIPRWRGRGLARLLTAAIEEFLLSKGVSGYQATVASEGETREHLTAFYRRLGFEDEGRSILWRSLGNSIGD